ncbi:MAG: alpha/beta hydrolase [Candidatus Kariarchaeaceae archaeon]
MVGISLITVYLLSDSENGWQKEEMVLHSSILGDDIDITVGLPPDYDQNSTAKYQTVYLLDGMYFFDDSHELSVAINWSVLGMVERMSKDGKLPDTILVGISYPPYVSHRGRYFNANPRYFRDFLRTELIPHIESDYNVITNASSRTLIGHSAGAHFAVFSLMADGLVNEQTISQIIAVSGTYHSSNPAYKEEEKLFEEIGIEGLRNTKLYLTIGTEDEQVLPIPSEPTLLQAHRDFTQKLENRQYNDFTLKHTEYEGYTHWDIMEDACEEGLEWLFNVT